MKRVSVASLFLFVLFVVFSTSTAIAATTIDKITLKPGESKSFSLEAQSKMKVGFTPNLTSDQAQQCKHNCIEISQVGGTSMASMYGATIGMEPKDGKIDVSLKNVETFPIEVELFHK